MVVVVAAPKWNEQRKNEPRCARDAGKKGMLGARENSTDGFHLPNRRREDRRKTVAAAAVVDP